MKSAKMIENNHDLIRLNKKYLNNNAYVYGFIVLGWYLKQLYDMTRNWCMRKVRK